MAHDKAKALSERLSTLAEGLEIALESIVGERVGFMLVMSFDDVAQYVSNVERPEGVELLESLLGRWKDPTFTAMPAHTNPEL